MTNALRTCPRPASARPTRQRRSTRAAVGTVVAAAGLFLAASAANAVAAGGGSNIASAPVVALGQQQFGNSSTNIGTDGRARSWWNLPLSAGDALTIDWEDQKGETELRLFPIGTTDFTFPNSGNYQEDSLSSSNYKSEFTYTVPTTGTYPLEFYVYSGSYAGPYDFTASVLHGISLGLPALTTLPQTGTIAVGVHTPDGAPLGAGITVSLQAASHSYSSTQQWQTIGTATPSAGSATVTYALPPALPGASSSSSSSSSSSIDVRAIATGAGYSDATSPSQTVTGPPAPTPTPTPAPTPTPPPPPTAVSRYVSLTHKSGRYRGRVSSNSKACYRSVTVSLYRKGKSGAYGSAVTRQDGSFTISHKKLKGKAYVYVAPATVGSSACSAATSKSISH